MILKKQESDAKKIWLVENNRFFLLVAADTKEEVRQHCSYRIKGPVAVYEETKPEIYFGGNIYVNQGGLFTLRYNKSKRRKELYLEWVLPNQCNPKVYGSPHHLYKVLMSGEGGTVKPELSPATPDYMAVYSFFPGTIGVVMNSKGEVISSGSVRSYSKVNTAGTWIPFDLGRSPVISHIMGPDVSLSQAFVHFPVFDLGRSVDYTVVYVQQMRQDQYSVIMSYLKTPASVQMKVKATGDIYAGQLVSMEANSLEIKAKVDFSSGDMIIVDDRKDEE